MTDLPAPSSPAEDPPAPVEPAVPPPVPVVRREPASSRRVGQLTVGWQILAATAWAAAFFAFAGVWKASEEIGIGTWWLGPRADRQALVIRMIPFALCGLMSLAAIYNVRRFPWVSLAGTAAVAVIAAFDISRSGGLALAQFAIAGALLLVSLASFGGRYVAGPAPEDPTGAEQPPSPAEPGIAATDVTA